MNEVCYVIASGPSLIGFDFDALPSGFRIGANRSGWLAKCDAICTVDRNFHARERDRLAAFGANAHIALPDGGSFLPVPGATYWAYARNIEGVAMAPRTLSGSNSGFASLNLAIQLGYTEIALLGFDFKWDAGRSHFHEGYNQRASVDRSLGVWAEAFRPVARQAVGLGVRITNFVGPMGSRVKAFPTAPLADLL
jgi:hypothetical protein